MRRGSGFRNCGLGWKKPFTGFLRLQLWGGGRSHWLIQGEPLGQLEILTSCGTTGKWKYRVGSSSLKLHAVSILITKLRKM